MTVYASLRHLSNIVCMLQERMEDVLGLKESQSVWQRNALVDAQFKVQLKDKIDSFMKSHTQEQCVEFLRNSLANYYTKRISLSKALEKIGKIKPTSSSLNILLKPEGEESGIQEVVVDRDIISEIRKCISDLSDIHILLGNILKGTVPADSVENKSLCDDKYLASLAKDVSSSPSGTFANTYTRFEAIINEIESAERQVHKLEERAASYSHTPAAEADKQKLKELEAAVEDLLKTPEASVEVQKLNSMIEHRKKHLAPGGASWKKASVAISAQQKVVDSFLETPEAKEAKEMVKEQRKRVYAHRKTPEAQAAAVLVGKRKQAVEVLEQRLVTEATQFCKMRNEILRSVANASSEISQRCHSLPAKVRDVFRVNPPKFAEEIVTVNEQLAYRK